MGVGALSHWEGDSFPCNRKLIFFLKLSQKPAFLKETVEKLLVLLASVMHQLIIMQISLYM